MSIGGADLLSVDVGLPPFVMKNTVLVSASVVASHGDAHAADGGRVRAARRRVARARGARRQPGVRAGARAELLRALRLAGG